MKVDCLFQFKEPVSPHLAVRLEKQVVSSTLIKIQCYTTVSHILLPKENPGMDNYVNTAISDYIHKYVQSLSDLTDVYIEAAGGKHQHYSDNFSHCYFKACIVLL